MKKKVRTHHTDNRRRKKTRALRRTNNSYARRLTRDCRCSDGGRATAACRLQTTVQRPRRGDLFPPVPFPSAHNARRSGKPLKRRTFIRPVRSFLDSAPPETRKSERTRLAASETQYYSSPIYFYRL